MPPSAIAALRVLTSRVCTAAARKPTAAKPRFGAVKKPPAKSGGGLGVKKMTTKVDDSLFDQAPAAEAPPKPAAAAAATLAGISSTLSVRNSPLSGFGRARAPLLAGRSCISRHAVVSCDRLNTAMNWLSKSAATHSVTCDNALCQPDQLIHSSSCASAHGDLGAVIILLLIHGRQTQSQKPYGIHAGRLQPHLRGLQ